MAVEYIKGDSLLHRLDARTKLMIFIGVTILSLIIIDPILMGAVFFCLYILGRNSIDPKLLNRNLRVLVVIFLTFSMFQIIFFTPENSHFLFYLIPYFNLIPVTVEGIIRGVSVFFRFFSVVLAVHLMLYTTPPVDLALSITKRERQRKSGQEIMIVLFLGVIVFIAALLAKPELIQRIPFGPSYKILATFIISLAIGLGLQRLSTQGLPPEMGIALTLGFATVGILTTQTMKITDAQKARGYNVHPKNLVQRVQVLTSLLLPIFLATLERSQDISIAILSRGFDYNISKRTYRRQLVFHTLDFVVIGILIVLIFASLALNYLGIANPTEQFILNLLY